MAMVIAKKGNKEIKVSQRSYDTLFKNRGYSILEEQKDIVKTEETNCQTVNAEETNAEEIDTIPISEMNKDQLAVYALKYDIDTSEAKNVREARQIIQKVIRDSKL